VTVASGIQRVISAGVPTQRIRDKGQQHLPGDETWLIGEQRASGEKKYYLASQPAETNLRPRRKTREKIFWCGALA
jgi:hypothetical protein